MIKYKMTVEKKDMDAVKLSSYAGNIYIYYRRYIYNLPDGKRAELIDGELYIMATPNRIHQILVKEFTYLIEDYIRHKNGDCEIYLAPFAVFLDADNKNYLEPDISVICDKNKLTDEGCKGAPDWIIGIVSPSSCPMDYN